MKIKENLKRFFTGTLCLTTFAMFQPILPAYAKQDYTGSNNICVDMVHIPNKINLEMLYKNPLILLKPQVDSLMIYGDMNKDLVLNAFDLVLMRKAYLANEYYNYADLNADGDLDADDLVWLENYLLLRVKSFPVYANFDSDGDGLSDYVEVENYSTSPHKADTDGDGLNDYFEVILMKTNPLEPNNISDEDPDNDGLTNAQESKYNTNPYSEDTDEDGLIDWQEIMALGTNPLLSDTDNDGLTDYDEVNALGTNPNNPKTDGTPDGKRIFNQTIAEDDPLLSEVNTVDNAYALSIDIEASGNAKRLLNVEKSGYTNVMKDGSAVGFIPEFSYPDSYNVESITLNFRIKDEYKSSVMDIFSDTAYSSDTEDGISGIDRFMVFKYFEEIDMQMPIEKVCAINGDIVSVKLPKESFEPDNRGYSVHNIGSYALIDLEVWGMIMNNNLMPDEVVEAYKSEDNSVSECLASETNVDESIITAESKIDTQSIAVNVALGPFVRTVNILNNYSKVGYTNSNNNFDTKVVGGHVYAVINDSSISRDGTGWNNAKTKCTNMGGHLMTISNDNEFCVLQYSLTSGNTKNCYWVGATGSGRSWCLVNDESVAEYLNRLEVEISGKKYNIGHFSSECGKYLYYADGLSYYDGKTVNNNVVGYICEWDSYAAYLNYLKGDAINGTDKEAVSSFFGTFILNGPISKLKNIDTDGDGINDYYELNWSLLHKVHGENTINTKVSYVDINKYLISSPAHSILVSLYSGNSKSNKVLNKTAVNTTIVGGTSIAYAATKKVVPINGNIADSDNDNDYLIGNEDNNPNYTDPTPIDMKAIDDTNMFNEYITFNGESRGTTTVSNRYEREVDRYTKGGGTNVLIDMNNGNEKVATIYDRDTTHDVEFFIDEKKYTASCIIVEIGFDSKNMRDFIYKNNSDFLELYAKSNKTYGGILSRESIDTDNKSIIKYTIATNHLDKYREKYLIKINPKTVNTDYTIKIYEETSVYAPNGGMLFKDTVRVDHGTIYKDYQALYIDDDTFRLLTKYDYIGNEYNKYDTDSMVAEFVMNHIISNTLDAYENSNEVISDIGNVMSYSGIPMILLSFPGASTGSVTWSVVGATITLIGAGAAFSSTYNNITKDYLSNKLTNILHNNSLNVCFNMSWVENGSPSIFNADWNSWDGQYINRIIGNTVLNVNIGLFGYDINGQNDTKVFELNLIEKYARDYYGY